MQHTFLLEPGRWIADGRNIDGAGEVTRAEGEAVFVHRPDVWVNDSWMRVADGHGSTYRNRYEFQPMVRGESATSFRSVNPALGTMHGSYAFVGDAILVSFATDDRAYSGTECLLQVDADTYRNFGVFFKGNQRMGSWD